MQRTLSYAVVNGAEREEILSFNVQICYEDFETGKHAKKTYDFLVANLGRDCEFSNAMWKFEVLRVPKLREMAVVDVASADIVIVSTHGGPGLPEHVRDWFEQWVGKTATPLAMVALFDCPREETLPIRNYLAELADRGRMAFFAQPDEWPGRTNRETLASLQLGADLTQRTLSTLEAMQRDSAFPRWGINE